MLPLSLLSCALLFRLTGRSRFGCRPYSHQLQGRFFRFYLSRIPSNQCSDGYAQFLSELLLCESKLKADFSRLGRFGPIRSVWIRINWNARSSHFPSLNSPKRYAETATDFYLGEAKLFSYRSKKRTDFQFLPHGRALRFLSVAFDACELHQGTRRHTFAILISSISPQRNRQHV